MKLLVLTVVGFLLSVPEWSFAQGVENFTLEAIVEDSKSSVDSKFELKDYRGKTVVLHFLLKRNALSASSIRINMPN